MDNVNSLIEREVSKLRSQGYTIRKPGKIVGESGITHELDVIAEKEDEIIAITSTLTEPIINMLIRLGLIKYDSKLDRVILITGRESTSEEKQIAESLGIDIVAGNSYK